MSGSTLVSTGFVWFFFKQSFAIEVDSSFPVGSNKYLMFEWCKKKKSSRVGCDSARFFAELLGAHFTFPLLNIHVLNMNSFGSHLPHAMALKTVPSDALCLLCHSLCSRLFVPPPRRSFTPLHRLSLPSSTPPSVPALQASLWRRLDPSSFFCLLN